jgi:hypothetical protein
MKRIFAVFFILTQATIVSPAAPARPMNDGISNTLLLAEREGSYEKQGGSTATAEFGETNVGGAAPKHTVWYRYQAPTAGRFIVEIPDQQGLRAELRLPGNPATTIPLQTIADGTSNTIAFDEERLSVDLTRGQWVYLVVDAAAPFAFGWRFVEVNNDFYKDAETLLGPFGTVVRSDRGARLSQYESGLGLTAPATWFQWTAPSTGTYFVDLVGSRQRSSQLYGNFTLAVYDTQDGRPFDQLGKSTGGTLGNGTTVQFPAQAGAVYYFVCHGFSAVADNDLWLSWYPAGKAPVLAWAHPQTYTSEASGVGSSILLKLYGGASPLASAVTVNGVPAGPGAPATGGVDYQANNLPVNFAAGERSRPVNIQILPNLEQEALETVGLALTNPTGGTAIQDGTSNTIFISEELTRGACGLAARHVLVREGRTAYLEVRRMDPGTEQIEVGWSIEADGSVRPGIDFPALSGTCRIGANELGTFIEIPIYEDGVFEGREEFVVNLSASPVSGAVADGTSNTIVAVEDNDYFISRAGRYAGVIELGNWGALVNCAVTNAGTASGTVDFQGVRYPFKGTFDAHGQLVAHLQRGTRPSLGLRLRFSEGWDSCEAAVRDPEGEWADGSVRWLPYNGRDRIAPQAGTYTVLSNGQRDVGTPFILTGIAKADGSVRFLGRMADNTPVAFGSAIALGDGSVRGVCAFAAPLYKKRGNFYGTLELGLGPQQPGGETHQWWLKPWRPTDAIYPALPFQSCLSVAVPFVPPARGQRITEQFDAALGDGSVRFVNGGTALDGTSNTILIGETNQVAVSPGNVAMKINPKNGTFTGTATPPGGVPRTFFGCFVQGNYGYGIGFYLGSNRSGDVVVEADDF